ncbi:alpha/beta hydrolase [Sphingobacterium oryzagri]|uniref:Alpha/beta hydrolase n=1 Tax=Sphingobacterium oryzagri TaxID=3025669 RepID=A0ABY7WHT1_9SPHI|nr:alpha/beta hydrolase [Sphingobacterium sp. KACC 22765]WDF67840.1 alpha/beta hydrolase [Sphingobacterium sp. KACC 22765]
MSTIINKAGTEEVKLHVADYGQGEPIILIHGWPLSHKSWEKQIPALVDAGYRVIAYDRRGFGDSDRPWDGYDYDTLASDLHTIISELQLSNVTLVGFSMGGGEVVRYITNYGESNIAKIALISSIIPLVKQHSDNPDGVPAEKLEEIAQALKDDRVGFLKGFHEQFYGVDKDPGAVSEGQLAFDFSIASQAAPQATEKAADAWANTDFRTESAAITVPTLIIHGKKDATVPFETAGQQANELIAHSVLIKYDDAAHGLNITHTERLNNDLLAFLRT